MKALGVALAACSAMVLWPSAVHANPIVAREAADTTVLATVPGSQAFDADRDADDGMFTAQAGLDNSAHFAAMGAMGTTDVFDDDHESPDRDIDVDGLATAANSATTVALRTANHEGDNDNDGDNDGDDSGSGGHPPVGAPPVSHTPQPEPAPHGPSANPPGGGGAVPSATPEPASMLLLATGLVGVLCFRRQLFA